MLVVRKGKAFPSGLLLRRAALPILAGTPRNAPMDVAVAKLLECSTPLLLPPGTVFALRRTLRSSSASLRPPALHLSGATQTVPATTHTTYRESQSAHCFTECRFVKTSSAPPRRSVRQCAPHILLRRPATANCRTQRRPPELGFASL